MQQLNNVPHILENARSADDPPLDRADGATYSNGNLSDLRALSAFESGDVDWPIVYIQTDIDLNCYALVRVFLEALGGLEIGVANWYVYANILKSKNPTFLSI